VRSNRQDWKSVILQNMNIMDDSLAKELYKSDKDIHISSDGGVHEYQGTFGVIISDQASPVVINHGKLYSATSYKVHIVLKHMGC
jgi:hypothetical protein